MGETADTGDTEDTGETVETGMTRLTGLNGPAVLRHYLTGFSPKMDKISTYDS